MSLFEQVQPVAEILFSGGGGIKASENRVEIEAPLFPLQIWMRKHKGRVLVGPSLKSTIRPVYEPRDLESYLQEGYGQSLERTYAPDRFQTSPEKVAAEIQRQIVEPATPLSVAALQAITQESNRLRELRAFIERISKGSAHCNQAGYHSITDPIRRFDPSASGRIEVRERHSYCELSIQGLSLEKLEKLVTFFYLEAD